MFSGVCKVKIVLSYYSFGLLNPYHSVVTIKTMYRDIFNTKEEYEKSCIYDVIWAIIYILYIRYKLCSIIQIIQNLISYDFISLRWPNGTKNQRVLFSKENFINFASPYCTYDLENVYIKVTKYQDTHTNCFESI